MAKHNTLRRLYQLKAFPMWLFITIGILAFGSFCITIYFTICGLPQKSADTDLMGVIVSVLSILITLLVAWQIYSTIKAKEELREIQKDIRDKFEKEIKVLQNQLVGVRIKQAKIETRDVNPKLNISFSRLNDIVHLDRKLNDSEKAMVATPLYKWLWNMAKSRSSMEDMTIVLESMQGKSEHNANFVHIDGYIGGRETLDLLLQIRYIQSLTKDIDSNPLKPTLL